MTDTKQTDKPADDSYEAYTVEADDMAAAGPTVDNKGQLIETFLSGRDFATEQWALQHVAPQEPGYHITVGRIAGVATGGEWRESTYQPRSGEKLKPSYAAKGQFESTVLATGEIKTAPWCYLPRNAAELLAQAFDKGAEQVLLDLEIGLQATGKRPPYRWTVRTYNTRKTEMQRHLELIRARQEARAQARIAAPTEAPMAMPEPAKAKTGAGK
jgi:hypothetical protein